MDVPTSSLPPATPNWEPIPRPPPTQAKKQDCSAATQLPNRAQSSVQHFPRLADHFLAPTEVVILARIHDPSTNLVPKDGGSRRERKVMLYAETRIMENVGL
ncbi:hypothetical protein M758_UG157000 [Ceratodon purpureus]|nr:hypothetical protein M758_UG157000 [Ceratodon purpureus]